MDNSIILRVGLGGVFWPLFKALGGTNLVPINLNRIKNLVDMQNDDENPDMDWRSERRGSYEKAHGGSSWQISKMMGKPYRPPPDRNSIK